MNRYFITGTDTDCGKTYVTRELIRHYANALALKPIASGCYKEQGQWISSDALLLSQAQPLSLEEINPWRFEWPVSPHIAAAREKQSIQLDKLIDYCLSFNKRDCDKLFIEGAGGLMVPLNDKHTWIDFLLQSRIPVIVVVGMKLGCINHALLTFSVLKAHSIPCLGWIANCFDPTMLALEENIQTISQLANIPLIARVPYMKSIEMIQVF